jgi:hypothetical protein
MLLVIRFLVSRRTYLLSPWFSLLICNNQILDTINAYARASELDPSNHIPTAYTRLVASTVVCLP